MAHKLLYHGALVPAYMKPMTQEKCFPEIWGCAGTIIQIQVPEHPEIGRRDI